MFWVEVCNQAARWIDASVAGAAAASAGGTLRAGDHAAVVRDAALLLRTVASRYLSMPLPREDEADLSRWLAAVTLRSAGGADGAAALLGPSREAPAIVATRPAGLPAPFEPLLSTALVQFAATGASAHARLHRCHGIVRVAPGSISAGLAAAPSLYPAAWEGEFAARAGIASAVASGQGRQCAVLIFSDRGGRYCSKACANASFAARKIAQEPAYFAAKQGRYRARRERERAAPRRRPEALMFLD